MSFSLRLTEDERMLVESYSKLHSISISEAFKRALFEKIEEEYDIVLADKAYKEYIDNGKQSRPISALWDDLENEI